MKRAGTFALAAVSAAMLGGCVIVDAEVRDHGWSHGDDGYGYLYGAEISDRGQEITILVHSNGCTERGDFDVDVDNRGDDRFHIGFQRVEKDNCKALVPEGRRLTWTYEELGLPRHATVLITNPVGR
jgi:hypothetical protein